ncbi:helix-turn-helix domain-containing protein [Nostoc sp. XA010]|uniref:helix-turn-helix domain-containing protein n=1 Tax=Nostoc sp. XA010 TaxID=2780407 RepID=UPI001E4F1F6A|nr:helix-turn-helix domain-containing protein [Nostoc sp. XA010]MCC5657150.1 helix-turn-helix domain-containing protein [Nostoc sp. XA010]
MPKNLQKSLTSEADDDQSPIEKDEKSTKVHQLPSDKLITDEVKLRMEVIQSLIEPCDRTTYSTKKKEAAEKLGVSIRQVERLLKKWREQRLVGLANTRSDKGKYRIEQKWIDFILKTYTDGNKGSKRITRHQVFLKVKGKARANARHF